MVEEERRDYLLRRLRELRREEGRSPTVEDMERAEEFPDPAEYISEFGSWNEAKIEAGLGTHGDSTVVEKGPPRRYSRERLLDKMRELDERLDHPVKQEDMDEAEDYPSATVYRQRFGSWRKAREKAGIDVNRYKYTDEELLRLLKEKDDEVDGRLTARDLEEDDSMPYPSVYYRRFDSFEKAKEKAGIETHSTE